MENILKEYFAGTLAWTFPNRRIITPHLKLAFSCIPLGAIIPSIMLKQYIITLISIIMIITTYIIGQKELKKIKIDLKTGELYKNGRGK